MIVVGKADTLYNMLIAKESMEQAYLRNLRSYKKDIERIKERVRKCEFPKDPLFTAMDKATFRMKRQDILEAWDIIKKEWVRLRELEGRDVKLTYAYQEHEDPCVKTYTRHGQILEIGLLKSKFFHSSGEEPKLRFEYNQDGKKTELEYGLTTTFVHPGHLYEGVINIKEKRGIREFPTEMFLQDYQKLEMIHRALEK